MPAMALVRSRDVQPNRQTVSRQDFGRLAEGAAIDDEGEQAQNKAEDNGDADLNRIGEPAPDAADGCAIFDGEKGAAESGCPAEKNVLDIMDAKIGARKSDEDDGGNREGAEIPIAD